MTNYSFWSGNLIDESGRCQENGTCLTALCSVKFGAGGIMVWVWFLGVGLGPLVPMNSHAPNLETVRNSFPQHPVPTQLPSSAQSKVHKNMDE